MIEIEIIDTGKRLPLSKKERLRMTFQAADFGEAGSGSGSFSTTCNVPITPQVIEALGFSIVPNATALLSAYKSIKARILQDENEIDKGFIRIDEDNATKKELKITFYGRNVDWFTALGDKTLKELNLSEYDHIKTNQAINELRTTGYVYLPVDYGTLKTKSSATINDDEIWPAVFVNRLVQQIFKEANYKVRGTIFDKGEFNRLLIPFSLEEVNMPLQTQINLFVRTANNNRNYQFPAYSLGTERILELNTNSNFILQGYGLRLQDNYNSWNTSTYVYTSAARINVRPFVNGFIFLENINTGDTEFTTQFILKKNGSIIQTKNITIGVDWPAFNFNDVLLEINDTLTFYIIFNTEYTYASYNNLYIELTPVLELPNLAKYELNTFLPNMKQSALIEYLFLIYGIIPSFDKATNTVVLDSISDLTVNGAEQWTGKLDQSQSIEYKYFDFVSDYAKRNNCIYTEDEDDTETTAYKNTYLEIYGSGSLDIDNDFLDGEKDYFEAPFNPTKQRKVFTGVANLNFQLPYIFKKDGDVGRILLFAGHRSVSELSNGIISTINKGGANVSTIPYSYFIPPLTININDPITLVHLGFDNPKDEYSPSTSIIQRTYYNLEKVLNKPISITCSLRLSAYDISRLKFNRLKYIQELGGYFYLNKVNQYDGSGEATECELIKWY